MCRDDRDDIDVILHMIWKRAYLPKLVDVVHQLKTWGMLSDKESNRLIQLYRYQLSRMVHGDPLMSSVPRYSLEEFFNITIMVG